MAQKQPNVPPQPYIVQSGDILFDIAQVYYGDGNQWQKIANANNITNPTTLQVGQQLTIPA